MFKTFSVYVYLLGNLLKSDNKTLLHVKILYHAIKSKYVLDNKCVFNRFINTIYEIIDINSYTKKINWSINLLLISYNIEKYTNSYLYI